MFKTWHLINAAGITCQIVQADCVDFLHTLDRSIDLIVTSPPYADARKKHYDSIKPDDYVQWFHPFQEAFWRILKPHGSFILNMKDKIVEGIRHRYVWRTLESLSAHGWLCIDDYIWHKKTSMPGYWPSRLRDAWEYLFHLAKDKRPYIDQAAVKIPIARATQQRVAQILTSHHDEKVFSSTGSGFTHHLSAWKDKALVLPTNVLHLSTETHNRVHPAVFPVELPTFFIKLLSKPNDLILDPFAGSGTTGVAAVKQGRHCLLIDKKYEYCLVAKARLIKACNMQEIPKNNDENIDFIDQQATIDVKEIFI